MPVPIELLTGQANMGQALAQAATALAASQTKGQLGSGDKQAEIDRLKRELENVKK